MARLAHFRGAVGGSAASLTLVHSLSGSLNAPPPGPEIGSYVRSSWAPSFPGNKVGLIHNRRIDGKHGYSEFRAFVCNRAGPPRDGLHRIHKMDKRCIDSVL